MVVCAVGAAVNVGFFVATHSPLSAGSAVLCGLLAVYNGVEAAR
jgi:hypothetical protein